ncbi:hypothetical protein RchiOBHm_Chr5g0023101 [Rosa chinensis]|uniref:Uncharacterized protein n=1 Tax=Rosa chinensis TaxID=74649 RepID=A0A2P6Q803_ROSCH|nr:hypothetical protein RchiOBHm_Chr5g0023101 [Rosa chinensis]
MRWNSFEGYQAALLCSHSLEWEWAHSLLSSPRHLQQRHHQFYAACNWRLCALRSLGICTSSS